MCILLYVKFLWCSSIPYIYGQLEGGTSVLSICALCYMLDVFSVVVFHASMVNWSWGDICPKDMCILLYVKLIWSSGITDIYGEQEVGGICPNDMWILLYVKLIWCSGLPWIYGRLEWGSSASRSPKFGVVVFRASLLKWGGQSVIDPCYTITPFPLPIDHISMLHDYTPEVCPRYLCIMLYMKLI